MSTIFFDFINNNNTNLLDDLPNNTKNLIIFCLYASDKNKINNLPSTLENIIIYKYRCDFTDDDNNIIRLKDGIFDDETIIKNDYLTKYIFNKMPYNCKLITTNKSEADKIYWSGDDYNDNIFPTNNNIKNKIKYINEQHHFFKNFNFDDNKDGYTTDTVNEKILYYENSFLFEKNKRHLLFELPNIINKDDIQFYKTLINKPQHYLAKGTMDNKKIMFFDIFIKTHNDKHYLNFVIDENLNSYYFDNYYFFDDNNTYDYIEHDDLYIYYTLPIGFFL